MRPIAELRRLFSPYEFAVAGRVLLYVMPVILMLLVLAGSGRRGFILVVVFILLGFSLEQLSRCPNCRRRPSSHYLVDRSTGEQIPMIARMWPEQVCSGCGTRLDGI
jgi:hypothetical protein